MSLPPNAGWQREGLMNLYSLSAPEMVQNRFDVLDRCAAEIWLNSTDSSALLFCSLTWEFLLDHELSTSQQWAEDRFMEAGVLRFLLAARSQLSGLVASPELLLEPGISGRTVQEELQDAVPAIRGILAMTADPVEDWQPRFAEVTEPAMNTFMQHSVRIHLRPLDYFARVQKSQ